MALENWLSPLKKCDFLLIRIRQWCILLKSRFQHTSNISSRHTTPPPLTSLLTPNSPGLSKGSVILKEIELSYPSNITSCQVMGQPVEDQTPPSGSLYPIREVWKEPWYDKNREAVRSISRKDGWPWGYVIYRTVYTPESDQVWESALNKINTFIYEEIDEERERHQDFYRLDQLPDDRPNRYLREGYQNIVMDDRSLHENASVDQIREHFRSLDAGDDGRKRYEICLVIDEESLNSIMAHPVPEVNLLEDPTGYVLAVDSDYNPGDNYDNEYYEGWMRAGIDVLFRIHESVFGGGQMSDICPFGSAPNQIPFYDGAMGSLIQRDTGAPVLNRNV